MEFVVDEIALAARTSRVTASHRLDLAQDLTGVLPEVFTALQQGSIDLGRARIITEGTRSLDREIRVAVADAVLTENDNPIWPHCAGLIWPHPWFVRDGLVGYCW